MVTTFASPGQEGLFKSVLSELSAIGYHGELLKSPYDFGDWFSPNTPTRTAPAAAFAQEPVGYDSACFVVVIPNGKSGPELINEYRALGAPRALEIQRDKIVHWRVSAASKDDDRQMVIQPGQIAPLFREHAARWSPASVLAAKNTAVTNPAQRDFIDIGLIPALEEHVRGKIDPLLRSILDGAARQYAKRHDSAPDAEKLFRLLFRSLVGKVMHDRGLLQLGVRGWPPEPGALLERIAAHYNDGLPVLGDEPTQRFVVERLWESVSLKNLSVETLAFVWENTWVTDEMRASEGIHATPPNIARYMVRRLPIESFPEATRRVVEPCCGSGTFLVAAMQRLRELLPPSWDARKRHHYFVNMLSGFDKEPFGLEVARSCLMLADFPNPNGWRLGRQDVFSSRWGKSAFAEKLSEASVVLCNPPFESFEEGQRKGYRARYAQKPAELLRRVLSRLPDSAVLGFVLPIQAIDGSAYREIRGELARRFRDFEVVKLPEGIFQKACFPVALLLAEAPSSGHETVHVSCSVVHDTSRFLAGGLIDRRDVEEKTHDEATDTLAVVELRDLWKHLGEYPKLGSGGATTVARGVEWNDFARETHIKEEPAKGFRLGFHTSEDMFYYQAPPTAYLLDRPESRKYLAWDLPWRKPKVIVNAVRKSRKAWRIAACPVDLNIICSQNFTAIWPRAPWTSKSLAAVLNGPIAAAFVATRENWKHLKKKTYEGVPLPILTEEQIATLDRLVGRYTTLAAAARDFTDEGGGLFSIKYPSVEERREVLRAIDQLVLSGYSLTQDHEDQLLAFFGGYSRPVPFGYGIESIIKGSPVEPSEVLDAAVKNQPGVWSCVKRALEEDRLSPRELFP